MHQLPARTCLKENFPSGPEVDGHAFTAGLATIGFANLHDSPGNRVAGSKYRHDSIDRGCARRQLLLLRQL